jgi:hypothetical protein
MRAGQTASGDLQVTARHIYVDETKERDYLLVASAHCARDIDTLRETVRKAAGPTSSGLLPRAPSTIHPDGYIVAAHDGCLADGEVAQQHGGEAERYGDVDDGRQGEHRDRSPAGLAQALQRELKADGDEREDQEPGAQVVDGSDGGLGVAHPLQTQRAEDRRGDDPSTNLGNRSQNWPSVAGTGFPEPGDRAQHDYDQDVGDRLAAARR